MPKRRQTTGDNELTLCLILMPRYEESAKKLLELLVSLAADLFDFEVAPWSTSFFGRFSDNSRYRFAGRDWFFCRIAFDIGAIETLEVGLGMQRRTSVHLNTR